MFDRNIHKTILLQILKDIYTDTALGPVLGLKGGTAAYLFYDLGRFSVDLDFDLLEPSKEDEIFEKITNILKNYGTLKDSYQKKHTLFFLISYDKESPNIKVEISRRLADSHYELKNYLGISMLVMLREDMFAHKLAALLERKKTANRDIFDIWFFLKNNWAINEEIINLRTRMKPPDYLKKCVKLIEGLSERSMLSGMGELLDEKQKTWAKRNLKSDVLFLLKLRIEAYRK